MLINFPSRLTMNCVVRYCSWWSSNWRQIVGVESATAAANESVLKSLHCWAWSLHRLILVLLLLIFGIWNSNDSRFFLVLMHIYWKKTRHATTKMPANFKCRVSQCSFDKETKIKYSKKINSNAAVQLIGLLVIISRFRGFLQPHRHWHHQYLNQLIDFQLVDIIQPNDNEN